LEDKVPYRKKAGHDCSRYFLKNTGSLTLKGPCAVTESYHALLDLSVPPWGLESRRTLENMRLVLIVLR
jgi:hypothetical protein